MQVRDYSGTYTVKMVPCIASPNGEFSIPPVCHPREPLTFDMDIRFQQVSHNHNLPDVTYHLDFNTIIIIVFLLYWMCYIDQERLQIFDLHRKGVGFFCL